MNTNNNEQPLLNLAQTKPNSAPLIFGFSRTVAGGVTALQWDDISTQFAVQTGQWRWLHLNRESAEAQAWLYTHSACDRTVCDALLQEDTRPRAVKHLNGFLLNLRGVNLNPGAEPEDMIALRIWATPDLVITTRARRVMAAEDMRDAFLAGTHPTTSGAAVVFLAHRLVNRIGPVVAELDEQVDTLEDEILDATNAASKTAIRGFRRAVLTLRRYIAPQREAIAGFLRESEEFLNPEERHRMRDTHDVVSRVAEDLDMIRERALLLQEQLVEERAEAMNSRLFILAIVSAIFLPLGFITGLFGVNVAGMPGVTSSYAFAILCGSIAVFSVITLLLFWKMKWI